MSGGGTAAFESRPNTTRVLDLLELEQCEVPSDGSKKHAAKLSEQKDWARALKWLPTTTASVYELKMYIAWHISALAELSSVHMSMDMKTE